MKNRSNQSGFTVVETLLILVIVGIIGFTGWFVWQSQNKANDTLDAANTSKTATYTKQTTKVATNQAQESQFLVIKEWSVKMKIPPGLEGVKYGRGTVTGGDIFVISTKTGEELGPACTVNETGFGWIQRSKTDITGPGGPSILNKAQPISGYYYYYHAPQAACASTNDSGAVEMPQVKLVKELIQSVEANN